MRGPLKAPYVPYDCKNPKITYPSSGDVPLAAADPMDEKVDAQQRGRMPHDSWHAEETAADGHGVVRRTKIADKKEI